MITELMLILIVLGIGIVFVVRFNARKKQQNEREQKEIEESTDRFKKELENTANEIIGRMESQASHLENLLDDSERNRTQLEGRVAELRKLLKRSEGQSGEIRDLLVRLDDAVEDVQSMQRQMDEVERKINSAINFQLPQTPPMMNPLPQMPPNPLLNSILQNGGAIDSQTLAQLLNQQAAVNRVQSPIPPPPPMLRKTSPLPVQPIETLPEEDEQDFSKVLEQTMTEPEVVRKPVISPVKPPDRDSIILSKVTTQPVKAVEAGPVKIETPTRKNQAALLSEELSGTIAERQARALAERQHRATSGEKISAERTEEIRKAALNAIKNATPKPPEPVREVREVPEVSAPEPEEKFDASKHVSPADAASIREMLLSGKTVEEIARETGLGRGAVELVQQLTRHRLTGR